MCCAAPPLSTRSPSGESNPFAVASVVLGSFAQKPLGGSAQTGVVHVQKLIASGVIKQVVELSATTPALSPNFKSLAAGSDEINWYCFKLPNHLGLPFASGRNMPMNIWFRKVPWAFALTGRLDEANTLFTACTSLKIFRMSSCSTAGSPPAAKYLPPPNLATSCGYASKGAPVPVSPVATA